MLKTSFDVFKNMDLKTYINLNKNEKIGQNNEYNYMIPITLAKFCKAGQFYDVSQ